MTKFSDEQEDLKNNILFNVTGPIISLVTTSPTTS